MDVGQIPLLAMLKERMAWLNRRQDVLSQNVANADVAQYTARDIKPIDFAQVLKNATKANPGVLTTTNPMHISPAAPGVTYDEYDSPDVESTPTGNTVSLESEMIKVADTQAQFQAATNLYAKAMDMMKTAIGRGGS